MDKSRPFDQKGRDKKELVCLVFILALACFFRLWKLDSIPPGLYPDEAINGNEAVFSPGKVFYTENNGREGLFINLTALSFKIFGISIWSFRIVPATIGILTVFGIYLLAKELFECDEKRSRHVALFASFFLAVAFWHVNFSRISFRAIQVSLVSIFAFYFLLKAMKRRSTAFFVISGIFFGLGLYTYIAFRVIFLILPLLFLIWYKGTKRQKTEIAYFLSAILIIILPLAIYFLNHPKDFISRAAGVFIFAQKNPIKAFFQSLITHLLMFNVFGDSNWRHNISGFPVLFWPVGILFLIGLIFSFKELINAIKKKNYLLLTTYYLLISWWFIMLLPGILTYEGIPHSLRTIGAIPPTFILAGLGATLVFELAQKRTSGKISGFNAYMVMLSLFLLVVSFVLASYGHYFELWAKSPEVKEAFTRKYYDIGQYLNSLPEEIKKYVIVNELGNPLYGISIPAQTPMFIETTKFGKPRAIYIKAEDLDKIEINQQKTVIIPLYDGIMLYELQNKFPEGKIKYEKGLLIYEIE